MNKKATEENHEAIQIEFKEWWNINKEELTKLSLEQACAKCFMAGFNLETLRQQFLQMRADEWREEQRLVRIQHPSLPTMDTLCRQEEYACVIASFFRIEEIQNDPNKSDLLRFTKGSIKFGLKRLGLREDVLFKAHQLLNDDKIENCSGK